MQFPIKIIRILREITLLTFGVKLLRNLKCFVFGKTIKATETMFERLKDRLKEVSLGQVGLER